MGVVMRSSKTSVAGKRFARTNMPSRLFGRRGTEMFSLNTVFLLLLLLATVVISTDFKKYFSSQDISPASTNDLVPIDFDKGDVDGAFAPILNDFVPNESSHREIQSTDMYLNDGAKFSDSSLEKGNAATSYEREGHGNAADEKPRPIPLPPADAPVLFPRQVNGVYETEESIQQRRQEALLRRKRRKREKYRAWKRRQLDKESASAQQDSFNSQPPGTNSSFSRAEAANNCDTIAPESKNPGTSKLEHLDLEGENNRSWSQPFQPIQDTNHYITLSDLEHEFGIIPANLSVVSESTLRLLANYDIRNDVEFRHLAITGNLTDMTECYLPIVRRGWGSVLGSAPPSIPSDYLYHVRHSGDSDKGYGMYATVNLPSGTVLGIHGGELMRLSDVGDEQYAWGAPDITLQDPTTGAWSNISMVLDASKVGNLLRFVNDLGPSKQNVQPVWVPVDNRWTLFYETTRAVLAGEELSVPYGDEYWGSSDAQSNAAASHSPAANEDVQDTSSTISPADELHRIVKRYVDIPDDDSSVLHDPEKLRLETNSVPASQVPTLRKAALRKTYLIRRDDIRPLGSDSDAELHGSASLSRSPSDVGRSTPPSSAPGGTDGQGLERGITMVLPEMRSQDVWSANRQPGTADVARWGGEPDADGETTGRLLVERGSGQEPRT